MPQVWILVNMNGHQGRCSARPFKNEPKEEHEPVHEEPAAGNALEEVQENNEPESNEAPQLNEMMDQAGHAQQVAAVSIGVAHQVI